MDKINIVAFGASNSKMSINKQLATYTAHQIKEASVEVLDLNDYEMPLFGVDYEKTHGIPKLAHKFKEHLFKSDGIIISFAEHNGAYSVAFKNILDWISRIESNVWYNKPMFLLGTSPGGRGASTALEIAVNKFSRMTKGGIQNFSLPNFKDNFTNKDGITDTNLNQEFQTKLNLFVASLETKG